MYVSAADNDYVHLPRRGLAGRLEHGAPGLLGAAKLHFGAFGGSIPGLVQQSAGTLDLYSMQIRASAFEGESVSVTDLLALTGSATLEGSPRRATWAATAAVQRRELHGRVHHGRGRLGRSLLRCAHSHRHRRRAALSSTGAVSGSSLSISGAASVGLLSSATGITGSTLTINNTANAGNFTTVHGRHADHHRRGLRRPAGLQEPGLHLHATSGGVLTGSVVCGDVTSLGTVSAPQLFASNTLAVTNTSDFSDDLFLTKNWAAGASCKCPTTARPPTAARSCGCWSSWSGTAGRPVRAHHDQRRGAGADQEPLDAAAPNHEPEELRLPGDRGQASRTCPTAG